MSNEKFNSLEFKVFNLIREGKSRSEIVTSGLTTAGNINAVLCMIYEKTDYLVNYHSARDKFKELQGFLRNNPTAFSPIPDAQPDEMVSGKSIREIIKKLNEQYKSAVEVNKIKLSVLADVANELERAG